MTLPNLAVSGLASGIDSASLIQQLMAIERQPINLMRRRISELETENKSFQSINTSLLALKTSIETLTKAATCNPHRPPASSWGMRNSRDSMVRRRWVEVSNQSTSTGSRTATDWSQTLATVSS